MNKMMMLLTAGLALAVFALFAAPVMAQTEEHGANFVDENGDGYNDNAPDHDGDGIPNGQDPDYVRPGNAKGNSRGLGFVDEDGDGINDNAPDADGDGIPNGQDEDWVKPEDGSGPALGRGAHKWGNGFKQDETNPKAGEPAGRGEGQRGNAGPKGDGSCNSPE
jgi:hypothetical protein